MYNTVIFDVDGTLIDTEKSIIVGLQKVLKDECNTIYSNDDLKFVLGVPAATTVRKLNLENPDHIQHEWVKNTRNLRKYDAIFPGIEEILQLLKNKGLMLGIVTSRTKDECDSDPILSSIKKYFDHIICADDTKRHKPNGDPLIKFLNEKGTNPLEAIYIGDTMYDFECACNSGVDFLWAGWGTKEQNINDRSRVVTSPNRIINYI